MVPIALLPWLGMARSAVVCTYARPATKENGTNMESAAQPPVPGPAPKLLLVGGARPVIVSIDMVRDALKQATARGIAGHVVAPAAALAATVPVIEAADAVSAVEFADPAVIRAWVAQQAIHGRRFDMVYALQEMAQVAAAEAAKALGVAGNPPEAVRRIRTKDLCRAALAQAGFAQPNVRLCASAADAGAFAAQFPGPWVVKPRDAMGSAAQVPDRAVRRGSRIQRGRRLPGRATVRLRGHRQGQDGPAFLRRGGTHCPPDCPRPTRRGCARRSNPRC